MNDARLHHDRHDVTLIAAHAAGDLAGRDLAEAVRLLRECESCLRLQVDLRTLARATAELPMPVRSRDFRLSPDDAARIRQGGWRRVVQVIAGPRFALAQPLGAALATFGLAGFLLVTLPDVQLGGAAGPEPHAGGRTYGAPAYERADGAGGASSEQPRDKGEPAAGGSEQAPGAGMPDGAATDPPHRVDGAVNGVATPPVEPLEEGPRQARGAGADGTVERDLAASADEELAQRSADTTLAILSGSFVIVGLALFGLRWTARRLGDG